MNVVGIDIGFGFTKASNGKETVIFKSIFGEATDIQFREHLLSSSSPEEHLHIELEGESFFVGELAERQSHVRSFTLDQNQFITNFAKIMAMAALSKLVSANDTVNLVTGLPVSFYRRHREELSGLLLGAHSLVTLDANGARNEIPMTVNQVRVIPQPFGSLFNLMMGDTAELSDKRYVQDKIGVVDVGFRTTDYTISDKTKYSGRGSGSSESGIARAFAMIAAKLLEQTGVDVELYRMYDAVARGSIKIRGKTIDLRALTEDAFSKLASAIATEVDRLWADDWDIDLIVVTGGGGAVLAPYLEPLLNGEVLALDPTADARMNNVRGYWKYGRNVWGGERQVAEKKIAAES
ncbi:MAG: ParM/StbA family protein [Gammaproteobacteria bacterium]|nr:MAG: ParM/StbA family protein [Gammaproteobacteria bacterium]